MYRKPKLYKLSYVSVFFVRAEGEPYTIHTNVTISKLFSIQIVTRVTTKDKNSRGKSTPTNGGTGSIFLGANEMKILIE